MAALDYSPRTLPLFESGDLEQGLVVSLEQLAEARRNPADQQSILNCAQEVAEFSYRLGKYPQAIDARQEMLARQMVLAENRPSFGQSVELARLGFYYHMLKQYAEAESYLQRAEECALQLPPDQRSELPIIRINRCHVAWRQGNLSLAREHLLEAWRLQNRYSRRIEHDFALLRIYATLMFEMGEFVKANKACGKAVGSFDTSDLPRHLYLDLSGMYVLRGKLRERDQQIAEALVAYERAAELLTQMPRRYPLSQRDAATFCAQAIARVKEALASAAIES